MTYSQFSKKKMIHLCFYLLLLSVLTSTCPFGYDYTTDLCKPNPEQEKPKISDPHDLCDHLKSLKFSKIKSGKFIMGVPKSEESRRDITIHTRYVTLTEDFEMLQTEVTQLTWTLAQKTNPSYHSNSNHSNSNFCSNSQIIHKASVCPDLPVESISWNETQTFINNLNSCNDDYEYSLPTEAQWEYATRGCNANPDKPENCQTAWSNGDNTGMYAKTYVWHDQNSGFRTHPAQSGQPNQWGLFNVHGNVKEMVQDWYKDFKKNDQVTDPFVDQSDKKANKKGSVIRGGSFASCLRLTRSGLRWYWNSTDVSKDVGFRIIRKPKN